MKTYNYLLSALLALAFFGVSANAQQPARRNGSNGVTARQENKVERQQNKVDKVQMPTNLSNQNATDLKVRDARIKETPQGSYGTTNRTPRVNGGSSGSGYGNGGSAYGNGGSGYGNRPPQGGNSGSGYGNRPPQGGGSGSGYGNRPPQGSGSGYGGSAYGNRPPQGGNNGSGNRPPQGGNNGYGYGNRPPQGGNNNGSYGGSGYGNRPPQGGNSGYGNRPPQGIPEVARRPALPPVIVYSRPEIYERTNANSIVVSTLFSSKAEAYDYIAALLDARYYTLTAYGNNYNRIISDVAFIPTPFDWTNPMTHNQFKMQFDISRVFGTVKVTITAYWRESVLSTGFTRLRFQPSDRYSTYYAWRVLEDFASEIPHTAIRYN